MKLVNSYKFYELGNKLSALRALRAPVRTTDLFMPMMEAQTALDALLKGDPVTLTRQARQDGHRLLAKVGALFQQFFIDSATRKFRFPSGDEKLEAHELGLMQGLLEAFDKSLAGELEHMPCYALERQGLFAVEELVGNAQAVFPDSLLDTIPSFVRQSVTDAGRCLAVGLSTAAGNYLVRATETMLIRYAEVFLESSPLPRADRDWALLLRRLMSLHEDASRPSGKEDVARGHDRTPDRGVIQMLAHVKERYRDPMLARPEAELSAEEAMALFTISASLMTLMARQIRIHGDNEGGGTRDKGTSRGESPANESISAAMAANHSSIAAVSAIAAAEEEARRMVSGENGEMSPFYDLRLAQRL
ncbi:MAG: hypothetical protein IPI58_02145 [Alphaproteobacteria bacterium]|nr:MAG: hypothetical protein IPI58_02145 [Alphaproteobacteria bacterium]